MSTAEYHRGGIVAIWQLSEAELLGENGQPGVAGLLGENARFARVLLVGELWRLRQTTAFSWQGYRCHYSTSPVDSPNAVSSMKSATASGRRGERSTTPSGRATWSDVTTASTSISPANGSR